MESGNVWMQYCEPKDENYSLSDVTNLTDIQTSKFKVPYDTMYHFDTVILKNMIYFTGGGTASPEEYYQIMIRVTITDKKDLISDKLANMNTARANHAMTALTKNLLYVVGGSNINGDLTSCEEYNIAYNKWREIAQLNEKKKWVSLCAFEEKALFVFGGALNSTGKPTDSIESLDASHSASKYWNVIKLEKGKEIWPKCLFIGCLQISSNCILLFGGVWNATEQKGCFLFNPEKKTIEKTTQLASPDAFYRSKPGIIKDTTIAIVGSKEEDLHTYDRKGNKWTYMMKKTWDPLICIKFKAETF